MVELFQIGHPGGDASVVNDQSLIEETVMEYLDQDPGRSVVISRVTMTDEAFAALIAGMDEEVDAGNAERQERIRS